MSMQYHGSNGIGLPYFLTTSSSGGGIPEAPEDGKQYGREDASWTEINGGGGDLSTQGLLVGANYLNCTDIGGFANKFKAIKVASLGTGVLRKVSGFIFNSYGSRKINVGVYDEAGSLLTSTGEYVLPVSTNNTFIGNLITEIPVVSGEEYWIGVWGDGIDLPTFEGFANYGSTFPDDVHCIVNQSITELPLIISSSFPFALSNKNLSLNAFQ